MAATGHGATFRFVSDRGTYVGGVTNISVETPTAEIADVTGVADGASQFVLIPTGSWKGGSVSVDFIGQTTNPDVQTLVRGFGSVTFSSPGFSVTRQVVLESASTNVSAGDVVKGSMKFAMTDYYG